MKHRSARDHLNFDIVWKNRFDKDPSAVPWSSRLCNVTKWNENPGARQRRTIEPHTVNAKRRQSFIMLESTVGWVEVTRMLLMLYPNPSAILRNTRARVALGTEIDTICELSERMMVRTRRVFAISLEFADNRTSNIRCKGYSLESP